LLHFELQAWERGYKRVAGIDEAGRGPLAGPVVAAAVVFDRTYLESEIDKSLAGITDSKLLSRAKREAFYDLLVKSPFVEVGVGSAEADEIDRVNILRATHSVMSRAVAGLSPTPDHVLVDGLPVPGLPCPSTAIVRGDSQSLSIAAASIVAKVTRDRIMCEAGSKYPVYGFPEHKGYGTKAHVRALFEYGPCAIHRRSFQPVKDAERIVALNAVRGRDRDNGGED
jgi:ribonuclease HII